MFNTSNMSNSHFCLQLFQIASIIRMYRHFYGFTNIMNKNLLSFQSSIQLIELHFYTEEILIKVIVFQDLCVHSSHDFRNTNSELNGTVSRYFNVILKFLSTQLRHSTQERYQAHQTTHFIRFVCTTCLIYSIHYNHSDYSIYSSIWH